jgi:uncharacterized membrane protein YbhN (UPF0104 family)
MESVARPAAGAAVLAVVIWRLGFGPFRDGLHALDMRALAAAVVLGAVSTSCCAWRWTAIARRHRLRLAFGPALAAYYRSVFLNLTLPGGVVGDVHRGLRHGRSEGETGRALRAVAWERGIGQVVQIVITIAVLAALPSPVGRVVPAVAVVAAIVAGVLLLAAGRRRLPGAWTLCGLVAASSLVVMANAAMFLVAAHTAGVSAPATQLAPLALISMLAMVLPGVAGWGPREGATAWLFGAAGLGASDGVATAVVYGVMALAAALPGALVLAAAWLPRPDPLARSREAADA